MTREEEWWGPTAEEMERRRRWKRRRQSRWQSGHKSRRPPKENSIDSGCQEATSKCGEQPGYHLGGSKRAEAGSRGLRHEWAAGSGGCSGQ